MRLVLKLLLIFTISSCAKTAVIERLPVKVVVVTMFEIGDDTGDRAGEFQLWKEGPEVRRNDDQRQELEEPLRGLIHGLPGTGKSKVILFMRRFFEEALGWEYGVDFIFVAFQNASMSANPPLSVGSAQPKAWM